MSVPALNQSLKILLCSITSALIILALASAMLPSQDDFDASNPYWNGHLKFSQAVNITEGDATVYKLDPRTVVLFIIGPSTNITDERINVWRIFVEEGGTLVFMDETGAVNYALETLGLKVKVDGRPMLDAVFYHNSWRIPKIVDVRGGALTSNVSTLIMNVPSILNLTGHNPNLRVLAYSSSFSFLDVDGNGNPSSGEPAGPFPVAAEVSYGGGRIILLSDSSLLTNSVIEICDNMRLLKNIVGDKMAFVDSGVWRRTLRAEFRLLVLVAYNFISAPEIKYSLTAAVLIAIYLLASGRRLKVHDEIQALLAKHPDWNRELLERLREARGGIE